jgi:hypothetical protein
MIELLGGEIGPRTAGSAAAGRAAEAIAEALRGLGLAPRMQPFPLLGYEAGEPELEIDGDRWAAGPCVYAHPTPEGGVTGRIRKIGEQPRDLGDGKPAPAFAVEDEDGLELGRIYANPVYGGAIPFLSLHHLQITVGPTVYVSVDDGERLLGLEGRPARLVVRGRFLPGLEERNVIAELRGRSHETVVVSAHYDSVWRGAGAIDNASGVESMLRIAEALVGRDNARTVLFVAFAVGSSAVISYKLKPQFVLVWLLGFYILLGIFESLWQLPGRLRERAALARSGGSDSVPPARGSSPPSA